MDRPDYDRMLDSIEAAIGTAMRAQERRLFVAGICGAQGSGKSTLSAALRQRFEHRDIRTAILSIDDLYLTRSEREELAAAVHPLFLTRGVPGTHDVALGLELIAELEQGRSVALPRFDKARDDRAPPDAWEDAPAQTRLLLLEGWCVGARPQADAALAEPVNALERDEDAQGIWRGFANAALAGVYRTLFARIDWLLLLAAPGFETVFTWRAEQENRLRAEAGRDAPGLMPPAELVRFVRHYERITRHVLAEMPSRADMVVELGEDRWVRRILSREPD